MPKANLGSQLSNFDTGSFTRARPRPNVFRRAPSNDPTERCMSARTAETNQQGRAGKTSYRNVHKANLGSQLSIFDTGLFARACPRSNEFTRAPSNDPPERPKRTDKGESGKRAARTCTKPTSGHNIKFLIRLVRPGAPSPERVHTVALKRPARTTETNRQRRAGQTSCMNVHKVNLESQLSISDMGSFARLCPRLNDPPELVRTGALK